MKKYFYYFSVFLISLNSCKNNDLQIKENYFQDNYKTKYDNLNIRIDTIVLDKVESSYLGDIAYWDNRVYFIDFRFGWVFGFDLEGNYLETKLGQGRGPNEIDIAGIDGFYFSENGNKYFFGSTNDIHIYDKNWEKIQKTSMNWGGSVQIGKGYTVKEVNPKDPSLYSLDYEHLKIKGDEGNLYLPIYSEHPEFNGLVSKNYYKEGRILAQLNLEDYSIERIFGRRTDLLMDYKYLMHHSAFSFDLNEHGKLIVANEIDPTIYIYDKDFNLLESFGVSGKEMDVNYQELKGLDIKRFQYLYFEDRPKRGFYTGVKSDITKNIIFRTYNKNNGSYDGLQIYENGQLLDDIQVPKGLKIEYTSFPYYYSGPIIDELNETITIYKLTFK
ncbi:hypothetical protein [Robertkochia sediminum]|uniref:hypothetical protein n=1 Tax=Robertkochia sediminum TaxID=2785326 RepID=UPI001934A4BB|nr:hypothetical protein [Robertkochia sediminum]MBL7473295.1 hypothetical protein [Robertkochia sediminum]